MDSCLQSSRLTKTENGGLELNDNISDYEQVYKGGRVRAGLGKQGMVKARQLALMCASCRFGPARHAVYEITSAPAWHAEFVAIRL